MRGAAGVELRQLVAGDTVAIVSPASWPDPTMVESLVQRLAAWGLRPRVAEHVLDHRGYLAGRDADRLADLNAAIGDPTVRAIVATRGGCGSFRLVPGVDLMALRSDPKPLLGFSDITALHQLWHLAGVPSLHGALVGTHAERVRDLLMSEVETVVTSDRSSLSANLEMLARAVGVVEFDLDGCLLLLEINRAAGLGMVDRAITQLRYSGALDGIVGIALGSIDQFSGVSDRGWTILDVLREHLDSLGVPVLGGLPLGHIDDPVTIPIGVEAELDARRGELTVASLVAGST